MPKTSDLPAERPSAPGRVGRVRARLRRNMDRLVLWAHRRLDRLDLVPDEFGKESPVDETDADAVRAEWRRQLELWIAYNPEEVFALKIGAGVLVLVAGGLWLLVAALG